MNHNIAQGTIQGTDKLRTWVDSPTDEEFTALHFAVYHGNWEIIQILVDQLGADFYKRNIYGANVLHIAAQGDQPAPLYYFSKIKGISIDCIDKRGSTPLHWACYSKSEFALCYILALKPNLGIQDASGLTPLHLAIKSVGDLSSTRPVRALLLKGADRNVKTKSGQTVFEVIKDDV